MTRKQIKDMAIEESLEAVAMDIPEDELEEMDIDDDFNPSDPYDYSDDISPEELLDAKIEAAGFNYRNLDDVEKFFNYLKSKNNKM